MGRYMYGHLIKKFEVSKIGKRNQLYSLDNDQVKYVLEELKKVINSDNYDIVNSNNKIEVLLKNGVLENNFNSLIKELNDICKINDYGFLFKDENKSLDNVGYFEQPLYGDRSYLVSDNLCSNGYFINIQVYSFLKDDKKYGSGDDSFISYLLTRLVHRTINHRLSSAIIFAVD